MYNSFVTTKVRPIRKLFIINDNDHKIFLSIFMSLMKDIDGILNLILQSDDLLFSEINKALVNSYDPDVIINYSSLDDRIISEFFNAITYNSTSRNYDLRNFCSPVFTFSGTPYLTTKDPTLIPSKVYASSHIEFTANSLFLALNFGVVDKKNYVHLKRMPSIFQDVNISCIATSGKINTDLFDNKIKYHNLTTIIGSAYTSSSIYEKNYNRRGYFDDNNKNYLFISHSSDFSFIIYFWNTRNSYNSTRLAWLPLETLEQYIETISNETILVVSNEKDKNIILSYFPNNTYIIADRYYFPANQERWINFEHNQYIVDPSDIKTLTHPNEKTFADIGFGGGFIFEIRGPVEFSYPKKYFLGECFSDNSVDKSTFPHYFTRLSNKGLSKYFKHFSPYRTSGITESFRLPSFISLLHSHFYHYGLTLKQTSKTFILEQLIHLLGGIKNASLISDKKIFNLLVSLTPHTRTQRLVQKAFPELEDNISQDDLISYIGTLKDRGDISLPSTIITMESIEGKLKEKNSSSILYHEKLQNLYNAKILLRGKYFQCTHCSAMLWFPLETLQKINHCVECGNVINIPIFDNGKTLNDHYKLNQLVARAVDQGQLSTLLLINYINKQGYSHLNYESNYEIFKETNLVSDIDVFVKIGSKLGLCECKSNSSFNTKQIDELINIAQTVNCDFIILSCLLNINDERMARIINYLNDKNLDMPVFVITENELFTEKPQRIYKYFEIDFTTSDFYKGPILLGK
ncbi:hypothetical protein [Brenneria uluponensis]|uniref:hypothetical protein n=1 Tax=Brenneria uluponensis TaxID=3057057 RepID=UPI0028EBF459|nr:hypothetical protein [Brenneria ulupoensis]